jgi:DNA topoisomerase-1
MGESFSAKDFRTWAGTLICACALARAGTDDNSEKPSNRKRKMVAAIKETAEILGNTPAVCRGSYICPEILTGFEKGKIIDNYFKTLADFIAFRGHTLHSAERALLRFLKRSAR